MTNKRPCEENVHSMSYPLMFDVFGMVFRFLDLRTALLAVRSTCKTFCALVDDCSETTWPRHASNHSDPMFRQKNEKLLRRFEFALDDASMAPARLLYNKNLFLLKCIRKMDCNQFTEPELWELAVQHVTHLKIKEHCTKYTDDLTSGRFKGSGLTLNLIDFDNNGLDNSAIRLGMLVNIRHLTLARYKTDCCLFVVNELPPLLEKLKIIGTSFSVLIETPMHRLLDINIEGATVSAQSIHMLTKNPNACIAFAYVDINAEAIHEITQVRGGVSFENCRRNYEKTESRLSFACRALSVELEPSELAIVPKLPTLKKLSLVVDMSLDCCRLQSCFENLQIVELDTLLMPLTFDGKHGWKQLQSLKLTSALNVVAVKNFLNLTNLSIATMDRSDWETKRGSVILFSGLPRLVDMTYEAFEFMGHEGNDLDYCESFTLCVELLHHVVVPCRRLSVVTWTSEHIYRKGVVTFDTLNVTHLTLNWMFYVSIGEFSNTNNITHIEITGSCVRDNALLALAKMIQRQRQWNSLRVLRVSYLCEGLDLEKTLLEDINTRRVRDFCLLPISLEYV